MGPRIALVGDRSDAVMAHGAIDAALAMLGADGVWVHTSAVKSLDGFDGIWCVPASPYADMDGALRAIRFARERGVPFLGTCGGFQHALIEYARNVLGWADADHAESNPDAARAVITPLACSLVERMGRVVLGEGLIRRAYGSDEIEEGYHCSYGLNPDFEGALFGEGGLRVTARDEEGSVRGVELAGHRFFVGTLFQSERRALRGEVPPLVRAFVAACGSE